MTGDISSIVPTDNFNYSSNENISEKEKQSRKDEVQKKLRAKLDDVKIKTRDYKKSNEYQEKQAHIKEI